MGGRVPGLRAAQRPLHAYLTQNLARTSAGLLCGFGAAAAALALAPVVTMAGQPAVVVGAPCDGAALYALFAGFVLAFPGPWRPKLWFIPLGVAGALFAQHQARCRAGPQPLLRPPLGGVQPPLHLHLRRVRVHRLAVDVVGKALRPGHAGPLMSPLLRRSGH
ncbi:MAG: hypothetical protein WKG07_28555 [Hymenobacter sp.]